MALWRRDGFFWRDEWTSLPDSEVLAETGATIVSLERWLRERDARPRRASELGVAVPAGKAAQEHLAELARQPLVALAFAKFADGRAFSYARLLRERHGFSGELRATGDVLIDEIPLMLRCGFDAFEVSDEPTRQRLEAGRLPGPKIYYQPADPRSEVPAGERPWLKKAV